MAMPAPAETDPVTAKPTKPMVRKPSAIQTTAFTNVLVLLSIHHRHC
jgi:hypothetical protein